MRQKLHLHTIQFIFNRVDASNPAALSPPPSNFEPLLAAAKQCNVQLVNFFLSRGFHAPPEELIVLALGERAFSGEVSVRESERVPALIARKFALSFTPELSRYLVRRSIAAVGWLLKRGVNLNGIHVFRNIFFKRFFGVWRAVDEVYSIYSNFLVDITSPAPRCWRFLVIGGEESHVPSPHQAARWLQLARADPPLRAHFQGGGARAWSHLG